MSLIYSTPIFQYNLTFSEDEIRQLSAQRIIQKNLVHFQGFPDRLCNEPLLCSQEYFGQYGTITKFIMNSKIDQITNKKTNNAYITFSTSEEAAYAILSVDSIKIDNQLVRAFFGTTKYCHHFLNNYKCFNSNKCIFLHHLADENDIITDKSKFGYSEHIRLAKKIINFGSLRSQLYVINNAINTKSVLPSIVTIYHKDDIIVKTKNHRRRNSNESESNASSSSSSSNKNNIDTRSSSNSSNRNIYPVLPDGKNDAKQEISINNNNKVVINNNNNKANNSLIFTSKDKSRFDFVNKSKQLYKNNDISQIVKEVVDDLSLRLAFFIPFENTIHLNNLEYNYCNKLLIKTKDAELHKIINCIF